MKITLMLRMYDPDARKTWWQPFTVRANSKQEFKAEIAKIKARYRNWTGEEPRG